MIDPFREPQQLSRWETAAGVGPGEEGVRVNGAPKTNPLEELFILTGFRYEKFRLKNKEDTRQITLLG